MRPRTRDALADALRALGVSDTHRAVLLTHARPEIELALAPADTDALPLGASRVGGAPDLPDEVPWPADRAGRPLSFVAQLDLAALPAVDDDLPREGLLAFFYDTVRQPAGLDPGDAGALRVLLCEENTLRRREIPTENGVPTTDTFETCGVRAEVAWGPARDPVAWPRDPSSGERFVDAWVGRAPEAKLLGHPDVVQEAMEGVCEAITRGLTPDPLAGALPLDAPARDRWVLLLQLGSDGAAGFSFGAGSGRLYVWASRDDLRRRDPSRAWAIVQDT